MIFTGSYPFLINQVIKTISQIREKNPEGKLTFIISSNNMRRVLKEYIAENIEILYNAEFFTKIDIARRITEIEPIKDLEKEVILDSIFEEYGIYVEGLSKYYSETIQRLKESNILPQDIPPQEKIHHIYSLYETKLKELRVKDREDVIRLASFKGYKTDFLFIFGFQSLTEIDKSMFKALLEKNKTFIFLPLNLNYQIFKKNPSLTAIFNFFKGFRYKVYSEGVNTKNQKLTSYLFSNEIIEEGVNWKNLYFIQSKGKKQEIINIAKKILKIKEKENINWHRIGVIINDINEYINDIKSVFAEYKIPYYLSEENRYIDEPVYKKIFSLFTLKEKNFFRTDFLNSLSKVTLKIDDLDLSILEKKLLEIAFEEGYKDLLYFLEKENYTFLRSLVETVNNLPDRGSIRDFVNLYADIIDRFFKKNIYTEKFTHILQEIYLNPVFEKLYKNISYENFNRLILHFLQEENVENRLKGDIVQVRSPNISEGIIFDYTFFIDMNERKYPLSLKEDPVLSVDLRSELEKKGLPKTDASYWQQILTFISIFNSSNNIFISYKDKDDKGNDFSPSIIVEELGKYQFGEKYFLKGIKTIEIDNVETLKEFKIKNVKNLIQSDKSIKKAVLSKTKRESLKLTEYEGKVKLSIKDLKLTPSKLQTFSDCPYRFFINFVIEPETLKIVEKDRIPPDQEGTVIHEILEFVYKKGLKNRKIIKSVIQQLVKEKFQPLLEDLKPSVRIFEERRISELPELLTDFVTMDIKRVDGKYIPEVFEQKKKVKIHGFKFTGKIDRADRNIHNGNYIIYDYKTGKKKVENLKEAILKGDYIQLILYKRFLEKERKNVEKIGLLFVKESDNNVELSVVLDKEFEKEADSVIETFLNLIKNGYMIPYHESEACSYCEHYDFCKIEDFFEEKYTKDKEFIKFINIKKFKKR
ncbi:PD-(D/E)XK nuclease family protein [Persephonella sp.]